MLLALLGFVWLLIWVLVLVDILRRPDLRISSKVLWALAALFVPVIGVLVYVIARPFGAATQAGFGIGMRVIQAGFLPVVALGFAVAPVAGQNYGARLADRVKATFKDAALLSIAAMAVLTVLVEVFAPQMIRAFSKDEAVIAVGVEYLRIIALNFLASGVIFVASSMFQAMGNTIPSLIASGVRLLLVAVPAVLLSSVQGFSMRWVWYLAAGAVWIQLAMALWMLRQQYATRLNFAVKPPANTPGMAEVRPTVAAE